MPRYLIERNFPQGLSIPLNADGRKALDNVRSSLMSNRHMFFAATVLAFFSGAVLAQQRFVIEHEIPGASKMPKVELRDISQLSNKVLKELGPDIQWVQSYVAGDKIYCVYGAPSEALIKEHAQKTGFPANRITAVAVTIDPTTAR